MRSLVPACELSSEPMAKAGFNARRALMLQAKRGGQAKPGAVQFDRTDTIRSKSCRQTLEEPLSLSQLPQMSCSPKILFDI